MCRPLGMCARKTSTSKPRHSYGGYRFKAYGFRVHGLGVQRCDGYLVWFFCLNTHLKLALASRSKSDMVAGSVSKDIANDGDDWEEDLSDRLEDTKSC